MSTTIDPIVIDKHGVSVAGHQLRGVTRWSARHDPERGLFEVQLTLCTSKFHADLGPGSNGMVTGIGKGPQAGTRYASSASGIIGIMRGTAPEPAEQTARPLVHAIGDPLPSTVS